MSEFTALPASRLEALRSRARGPGVASFFYFDAHFGRDAVKLMPGEYFAHDNDVLLMTTLGSCIAACLWDRHAQVGGMNHFMLPEGGGVTALAASGRYGSYAMELLINDLMKRGATRATLEAKVFGGAQVISGMHSLNIGEANTAFVLDYLKTERIPVVARDVLSNVARKVCFIPGSGKAMVKRLTCAPEDPLFARERTAARQITPAPAVGGSVDLF
ncbi:MAG: chemoreceptor glutamine deamidase CheD [Burkholderiales bacterium]